MTTIFTIGHSTRAINEFIEILRTQNITQLVDIRTIPKSRHNPQYGHNLLSKSLEMNEIEYVYLKELGGLRPAVEHSINEAWHNKSFRNYADYMQSDDFKQGLARLIDLAHKATTAIMCAEAVPWRCHRSLVSDALLTHDISVKEIISISSIRPHQMTSFAVTNKTDIYYPKSALEENDIAV